MRTDGRRGGALLAVLWLSAGLAAIAFSVASTVRGETERASTTSDGVRSYFLATGAVERALLYLLWGGEHRNPDGSPRYYENGMRFLRFSFPTGEAVVEVDPEASKLNLNTATAQELLLILNNLGVDPARVQDIVAAIMDWRSPMPPEAISPFDRFYLSRTPSFRARHASFEETEEVMLVKGMTPDIYHGWFARDQQGALVPRSGLKHCVSVYGSRTGQFDVNGADPALLLAAGIPPDVVERIVMRRRASPFRSLEEAAMLTQGIGMGRLSLARGTIFTFRATARLRLANGQLSDMRRSVGATVKFFKAGTNPPYQIIRWYDYETSGVFPI